MDDPVCLTDDEDVLADNKSEVPVEASVLEVKLWTEETCRNLSSEKSAGEAAAENDSEMDEPVCLTDDEDVLVDNKLEVPVEANVLEVELCRNPTSEKTGGEAAAEDDSEMDEPVRLTDEDVLVDEESEVPVEANVLEARLWTEETFRNLSSGQSEGEAVAEDDSGPQVEADALEVELGTEETNFPSEKSEDTPVVMGLGTMGR